MSRFGATEMGRPVETYLQYGKWKNDPNPQKCDMVIGVYRNNEGNVCDLDVVKLAEKQIANDDSLNHEYLPITGLPAFTKSSCELVLGRDSPAFIEDRYGGCQGVGGSGSLFIGLAFLRQIAKYDIAYVSKPTWEDHIGLCEKLGYSEVREYTYWDPEKKAINFTAFLDALKNAPENAVILLHAIAHNPTGMDPSHDQWKEIATVMKERKLFPFFDLAYQGFATGDLESDAWAPRYFVQEGFECFIAQTFSKNLGLYGERVGNLCYVVNDASVLSRMESQIKLIVRQTYSNPPSHGARIVATVLNNPALLTQWKQHVETMCDRIKSMRVGLFNKLKELGTPGTWTHITAQNGMFSFTGLNPSQVEELEKKYHIYMLKSGRMNMSGLNTKNLDYVAKSIHEVVSKEQ
ncbi:aspartate aminotransferase, cytoplasmic-like isoform X2 [Tubulanus polymorphus]|uniref:aspartate aminotransferase, cytoplasmic-like isoform X2 n=1 Tax=Tubulanus polymorphus TaxID=672921 RepID=UPI003DA1E42B